MPNQLVLCVKKRFSFFYFFLLLQHSYLFMLDWTRDNWKFIILVGNEYFQKYSIFILTTHLLCIHYLCILKNKREKKTHYFQKRQNYLCSLHISMLKKLPLQDNVRDNKNAYENKKEKKREWMRWTYKEKQKHFKQQPP